LQYILQNKIFIALTDFGWRGIDLPEVYVPVIFGYGRCVMNNIVKRSESEIRCFHNIDLHGNMFSRLVFLTVMMLREHLLLMRLVRYLIMDHRTVYLLVNDRDALLNDKFIFALDHIIGMYRQDKYLKYHEQAKKMSDMSEKGMHLIIKRCNIN
jgi:hypothetical protein